jgi:hypothetical protein
LTEDPRVEVTAVCDINPASIDRVKTAAPAAAQARVFKDAGRVVGGRRDSTRC